MPTSEFDPLKAAREELVGVADVYRVCVQREREAEEALALAERELNAIRKIIGWLRISMDGIRDRITQLVESEKP